MTGRQASARRRVLVLLNPAAGAGRPIDLEILHLAEPGSLDLDLVVPDPADQATQLAEASSAVREGVDAVVVHGGDGMTATGINLVACTGVPLGIVPAGTGNDFARAAGIPRRDPVAAIRGVLHSLERPELRTTPVDALHVRIDSDGARPRELWVANSVNIGFDAWVNQRANAMRDIPRALRYLVAFVRTVPKFRSAQFGIAFEGGAEEHIQSALVCVQNGPYIGNGIPLAPAAELADGRADASLVRPVPRLGLVVLFPLIYFRAHRILKPLSTRSVSRISISVPENVPVFADGEELVSGTGTGCRVEVEIVPGAVTLLR